jgi:hypothetical protein
MDPTPRRVSKGKKLTRDEGDGEDEKKDGRVCIGIFSSD